MGEHLRGPRSFRAERACLLLTVSILALGHGRARALGPDGAVADEPTAPESRRDGSAAEPARVPDDQRSRLEIACEGRAEPGEVVTLRSSNPTKPTHRRWMQIAGPPAVIECETARGAAMDGPEIRVTIPQGARNLGFALAEGRAGGIDIAKIDIPVETRDGPERSPLLADAGPDQAGILGQPITLRGEAKGASDDAVCRWLPILGPSSASIASDGRSMTFAPVAIGTYRFALVVASGGRISEPDYVDVAVAPPPPPSPDRLAREGLASIPGGTGLAEPLAIAFESVAARMDLYGAYGDVYAELSRRLDAIVPNDPASRSTWSRLLFEPLTGRLVETMRTAGLDLLRPEAQVAPLGSQQKDKLADLYKLMAKGFRASRPAR